MTPASKVLVAGIGNVFRGDDGVGVAVAGSLAGEDLGAGVIVRDAGIRGMHLAYELLDGFEGLVLVDAVETGNPPGSVSIIEPDVGSLTAGRVIDAHSMDPATVLAALSDLGGGVDRVLIVAVEPADLSERLGLSGVVEDAIPAAVAAVQRAVQMVLDSSTAAAPAVPSQEV